MIVAHHPSELLEATRAVAIGTFDGVHRGHRAVVEAAKASGLRSCVLTFHPHPREVLGYEVKLLSTFERRIELLGAIDPDDALAVEFTTELAQLPPEEFTERWLRPIGARMIFAGANFRFGKGRSGDLALLRRLGFDVHPVPTVEAVSSSRIRAALREGDIAQAAEMLGRPPEIEGVVVSGDQRGGTLGYPTANLSAPLNLLVPAYGIYAGEALGHRIALSIGVNPHYGGDERRIEAFLLDFDGDLYGDRLRLEVWQHLREERAFESEQALIEQIATDVERARTAERPA